LKVENGNNATTPLRSLSHYNYTSTRKTNQQQPATMATDQIRQMVNFILQEAHEKANEIRVKVCFFFR